jgi:hypothetical protein
MLNVPQDPLSRSGVKAVLSDAERMMEANSKISDLFEKVYQENHILYRALHERYQRVEREMEELKSLYVRSH